jgi:trimeric autotransporter adhesin
MRHDTVPAGDRLSELVNVGGDAQRISRRHANTAGTGQKGGPMRPTIGVVRWLVRLAVLLAFLLAGNHQSWAGPATVTFRVSSPLDGPDSTPGDGECETAPGNELCTLRAAIQETNALPGPNIIAFAITGVISVSASLPNITDSVSIIGPGSAALTISGTTLYADAPILRFGHDGARGIGRRYTVSGLRLSAAQGGPWYVQGIRIDLGTLTLDHVRIEGLVGGLSMKGGDTRVTILNSSFHGNGARSGGAILNDGATLVLRDSTLQNNGASWVGGALHNGGTAFIYNSVFSDNRASGTSYVPANGGAIINYGHLSLVNSTVSSNTLTFLGNGGNGITNFGVMTLTSSAVISNITWTLQGVGLKLGHSSVTFIRNTIIANNGQFGDCQNEDGNIINGGTIIDGGYNLVEDNTCGFTGGADPLLAALADNGGPTHTHALLASTRLQAAGGRQRRHDCALRHRRVRIPQPGSRPGVLVFLASGGALSGPPGLG